MTVKSFSTSICLTNEENIKYMNITKVGIGDDVKYQKEVLEKGLFDTEEVLEFFKHSIKSIKYVRTFIGSNNYKECLEIKNSTNSNLIVISDDYKKYFSELDEYLDSNRNSYLSKYAFELMTRGKIDKVVFCVGNNEKNYEISINNNDNKKVLTVIVPHRLDEKRRTTYLEKDAKMIWDIISDYLFINGSGVKTYYEEGMLGYLNCFHIYTNDNAEILINENSLCKALQLNLEMLKKDLELKCLKEEKYIFEEKKTLKKFKVFKNNEVE